MMKKGKLSQFVVGQMSQNRPTTGEQHKDAQPKKTINTITGGQTLGDSNHA